jgi:hypothetical protein
VLSKNTCAIIYAGDLFVRAAIYLCVRFIIDLLIADYSTISILFGSDLAGFLVFAPVTSFLQFSKMLSNCLSTPTGLG